MPMSPEARARLAARNRETQVWKSAKNTGAKTPEGKRIVSQNALKHGARHTSMRAVADWVTSIKALLHLSNTHQALEIRGGDNMRMANHETENN